MGYLVSILGTHTPVGEGGQIYWVSIHLGRIAEYGVTLFRSWAPPHPPPRGRGDSGERFARLTLAGKSAGQSAGYYYPTYRPKSVSWLVGYRH